MSVSHMSDVLQTPALWRLAQYIREHQEPWQQSEFPPDLERFERELHEHVMAVERDLLADELGRYDVTADEVTVEGVSYRRSLESPQTYVSAAGPITVTRHLYRPAGRSTKSIGPLELGAGIVQGLWTPRAARQGAFVMAHLTPRESALLFEELGGMQPSRSVPWIGCPRRCQRALKPSAKFGRGPYELVKRFLKKRPSWPSPSMAA